MLQPEPFQTYIDTVAEQVRWKRARPSLTAELRTHLLDQYDACMAKGLDEGAAAAESLRQMGDPVEVGTALDRTHRPKPQWGLLGLTAGLVVVGLVLQFFVLRDTATRGSQIYNYHAYIGQALATAVGLVCMLSVYFLDYTILGKHPWMVSLGAVVATGTVLFCSRKISGISYYTQYLVLAFPAVYAIVLYALRGKGLVGVWRSMAAFALPMAVALLIPSLSEFLLLAGSGLVLLLLAIGKGWFGGSRKVQTGCVLGVTLALSAWIWGVAGEGILRRLTIALHPEREALGVGYWGMLLRNYLAGAKPVGTGSANSFDGYSLLDGFDAALTWVIHKAGWLTGLGILLLLAVLLLWGFLLCRRQQSMLGRLLGTAVLLILTWQTVLYASDNLGFFLFRPLSLPLLSYGKCYQIVNLTLLGLLLSVFRGERLPTTAPTAQPLTKTGTPRITWQNGDLVISLRRKTAPHK